MSEYLLSIYSDDGPEGDRLLLGRASLLEDGKLSIEKGTDPRMERALRRLLAHDSLPWNLVRGIGVIDDRMRARVESTLAGAIHQPKLLVKRDWYY